MDISNLTYRLEILLVSCVVQRHLEDNPKEFQNQDSFEEGLKVVKKNWTYLPHRIINCKIKIDCLAFFIYLFLTTYPILLLGHGQNFRDDSMQPKVLLFGSIEVT